MLFGLKLILDHLTFFLQSIGFLGPGIALLGLNVAKSPIIASAWLTIAVGLKSFGHSGFLVNLQVLKFTPKFNDEITLVFSQIGFIYHLIKIII
jgi:hypothetical protein